MFCAAAMRLLHQPARAKSRGYLKYFAVSLATETLEWRSKYIPFPCRLMRFQDPEVAIALHRLEVLATAAAVFAAATFVGTATTSGCDRAGRNVRPRVGDAQ
jgi:hypothetical protein